LVKANIDHEEKNMLDFNIAILEQVNSDGKKMLIEIKLTGLTAYYTQQPILRLITFLNTQMLPSFDIGSDNMKEAQKKTLNNNSKPTPSEMDLKVQVDDISVFLETEPLNKDKNEYLQLNIVNIKVRNEVNYRSYIEGQKDSVLVETYIIKVKGIGMYCRYFDIKQRKHEYEFSNKLDVDASIDMIANPLYYKKEYPESFKNGMRISCLMTPFVMRINQRDYSFIMKLLNWSIIHDDGVDRLLYDMPDQLPQPKGNVPESPKKKQDPEPLYVDLVLDCVSLFVMNKGIPLAFLMLDNMTYNLKI
jgi:hypothetical protein